MPNPPLEEAAMESNVLADLIDPATGAVAVKQRPTTAVRKRAYGAPRAASVCRLCAIARVAITPTRLVSATRAGLGMGMAA